MYVSIRRIQNKKHRKLDRTDQHTLSYSSAVCGQSLFWWWSVGCSNFQEYSSVTTDVHCDSSWSPRSAKFDRDLFSGSVLGVSLYVVVTSLEYLASSELNFKWSSLIFERWTIKFAWGELGLALWNFEENILYSFLFKLCWLNLNM